jgi:hypothetical protein
VYNYNNPFLTDAFALMALSAMMLAIARVSFGLFCIASVLGVLCRETVIFLVPAWLLTRSWRKGFVVIIVSLFALLLPRYLLPSDLDLKSLMTGTVGYVWAFHHPYVFMKSVLLSWGFLWPLAILGICLMPKDRFSVLCAPFLLLLLGAFLSSLIAVDTERMYSVLAPVFAISCAEVVATLTRRKGCAPCIFILAALLILQGLALWPNVVFDKQGWMFRTHGFRLMVSIVGAMYCLWIAFVLRGPLVQGVQKKIEAVRGAIGRICRHNSLGPEET